MIRRAGGLLGLVGTLCLLAAPAAVAAPVFTPVSGSPFAAGNGTGSVAFRPDGELLATANYTASTVLVFSLDSVTGWSPSG